MQSTELHGKLAKQDAEIDTAKKGLNADKADCAVLLREWEEKCADLTRNFEVKPRVEAALHGSKLEFSMHGL